MAAITFFDMFDMTIFGLLSVQFLFKLEKPKEQCTGFIEMISFLLAKCNGYKPVKNKKKDKKKKHDIIYGEHH